MQLMQPPVHISTATTFPCSVAMVNALPFVLNHGPPPTKSGALTGLPAPAGDPAMARTISPRRIPRNRIAPPPCASNPSLARKCFDSIMMVKWLIFYRAALHEGLRCENGAQARALWWDDSWRWLRRGNL